jgi:hypothetical protein
MRMINNKGKVLEGNMADIKKEGRTYCGKKKED